MSRSLTIVAHGSSVNPASALTVVELTARLAEREDIRSRFDVVEARFLKQEPALNALEPRSDQALVIPFFMSDGYFVREVLPKRLPADTQITRPVGTCALDEIVRASVQRFASDPHLVLVGHGTERSETSAATVLALSERLRPHMRSVTCAFVDQDPRLPGTLERIPDTSAPVVVVPYFAFAGPHTEVDIPEGLGLPNASPGPHSIGGHLIHYAPAIGTDPGIVDVLARLAINSTSTRIERLTSAEAQRLREIRLAALREAPNAFGSTLAESETRSLDDWRQQLEDLPTFVAVRDGRDVGMVRGMIARSDDDPATAYLISMWVSPTVRGQGVGGELVDALVEWARQHGIRRLLLDVMDTNAPAVALYARKGFVPTGNTSALAPPRDDILEHERVLVLDYSK